MNHAQGNLDQATPSGQMGAALHEYSLTLGTELYGVASAADYARAFPDKPHPTQFVENAQSIIFVTELTENRSLAVFH